MARVATHKSDTRFPPAPGFFSISQLPRSPTQMWTGDPTVTLVPPTAPSVPHWLR